MTSVTSPPKFSSKDELCSKIDEVLMEFFTVLAELYKEQDLLNDQLKSGFLNMSRSRYSMGIKRVSIEQCDQIKMKANMRVNVEEPAQFSLEEVSMKTDIEGQFSEISLDHADSDKTEGLRKRNVDKSEDEQRVSGVENVAMKTFTTENSNKEKTSKIVDPIKWFGVLVPPALRQSQKDFKTSVVTAVSIANLQSQLETLSEEYASLMKMKKTYS